MNVAGRPYRTIWLKPDDERVVQLIDQRALPHQFIVEDVRTVQEMAAAMRRSRDARARGASYRAAAGYGMYLAMLAEMQPDEAAQILRVPTDRGESGLGDRTSTGADRERCDTCGKDRARARDGDAAANDDAEHCRQIGLHGLELIDAIAARKNGQPVNILTHCNAGLAGLCRLWVGDGSDLRGARSRHPGSCLGG